MTQTGVPLVYLFHFLFFFSAPPPRREETAKMTPESAGITISGLTGETITRHPGSING